MNMCEILRTSRRIAVLGASPRPDRTAHDIANYLSRHGYEVVPVNPRYEEIQGARCYKSLAEIPQPVDIVDVFRPAEEAAGVAEQAAAIGAKTLWLQLEIRSEEARAIAEAAGMNFIEDNCLGVTVNELGITK